MNDHVWGQAASKRPVRRLHLSPGDSSTDTMDAFVYGTLTDPDRAREVLGHADFGPDATLVGLQRVDGRYPTLAPGGETQGRVLQLRDGDLDALDAYEGVEEGLYVRVQVPSELGPLWTYVGDPDALGMDVEWPGDDTPFTRRVQGYLDRSDVRVEL